MALSGVAGTLTMNAKRQGMIMMTLSLKCQNGISAAVD